MLYLIVQRRRLYVTDNEWNLTAGHVVVFSVCCRVYEKTEISIDDKIKEDDKTFSRTKMHTK